MGEPGELHPSEEGAARGAPEENPSHLFALAPGEFPGKEETSTPEHREPGPTNLLEEEMDARGARDRESGGREISTSAHQEPGPDTPFVDQPGTPTGEEVERQGRGEPPTPAQQEPGSARPIERLRPGNVFSGYEILDSGRKRDTDVRLYKAQHLDSGQLVAIKQQPREQGEREAEILGRLDHPGIVRLLAHEVRGEQSFLVEEWVQGARLDAYKHKLPPQETLALGQQLAEALDYLHAQRIIHADMTGKNIMVGEDGRPVLIDFGFSEQHQGEGDEAHSEFLLGQHIEIGMARGLLASLLEPGTPRWVRQAIIQPRTDPEGAADLKTSLQELSERLQSG